jgi:chromosome segregation ATPase
MVKTNYKKALYVIGALVLLYGIIWISTRKPQMPTDIKATIDSLTNVNKQLIEQQKQIDSTIHAYETEVHKVDFEINNIKEKTTVIKEYYHEVSQQVDHYNATQVDSFFKARYNY